MAPVGPPSTYGHWGMLLSIIVRSVVFETLFPVSVCVLAGTFTECLLFRYFILAWRGLLFVLLYSSMGGLTWCPLFHGPSIFHYTYHEGVLPTSNVCGSRILYRPYLLGGALGMNPR